MTPEIWPVIHALDRYQVLRCAGIAADARCEGVMLISMHGDDPSLDSFAADVRSRYPALAVGVNYLSLSASEAIEHNQYWGWQATWTDRQEFTRGEWSAEASKMIHERSPDHKVFAAVAFKGQPTDPWPGVSAEIVVRAGMIPTTSGPATGIAPEIGKIRDMRAHLGPKAPLAIASGITPENVGAFAPLVSHILVSTGISRSFHEFDPDKLARLIQHAKEAR